MTPTELLQLLTTSLRPPGTVWRGPDGLTYVICAEGREMGYKQQGYQRLGTVAEVREATRDDVLVRPGDTGWTVMEDLGREISEKRRVATP